MRVNEKINALYLLVIPKERSDRGICFLQTASVGLSKKTADSSRQKNALSE
ncbi:MAG TPA: hypothetical protein VLK33_03940 [Terriglobales bacterium]|nr:hypothetical protein [Terriglobales bacterium]